MNFFHRRIVDVALATLMLMRKQLNLRNRASPIPLSPNSSPELPHAVHYSVVEGAAATLQVVLEGPEPRQFKVSLMWHMLTCAFLFVSNLVPLGALAGV